VTGISRPFRPNRNLLIIFRITVCLALGTSITTGYAEQSGEENAVAYLIQEVPFWYNNANCFSCHNNGDGARALYTAMRAGFRIPDEALADTNDWLSRPSDWDDNPGTPGFSDKELARIQFAAALVEAVDAGVIEDRSLLTEVARSLLPYQDSDGSWHVEGDDATIGSPATYGAVLATYMTRRTLEAADPELFGEAISRADRWLISAPAVPTMDRAALILALGDRLGSDARQRVIESLASITESQSSDGGWGAYPKSPSEPFDTALVLLALASLDDSWGGPNVQDLIGEGRAFLLETQFSDGGWVETTRPSGSQSYAEHMSTTGWATLALLETRPN
jgi:hypothetical protein